RDSLDQLALILGLSEQEALSVFFHGFIALAGGPQGVALFQRFLRHALDPGISAHAEGHDDGQAEQHLEGAALAAAWLDDLDHRLIGHAEWLATLRALDLAAGRVRGDAERGRARRATRCDGHGSPREEELGWPALVARRRQSTSLGV